jgi:hypothetical protein
VWAEALTTASNPTRTASPETRTNRARNGIKITGITVTDTSRGQEITLTGTAPSGRIRVHATTGTTWTRVGDTRVSAKGTWALNELLAGVASDETLRIRVTHLRNGRTRDTTTLIVPGAPSQEEPDTDTPETAPAPATPEPEPAAPASTYPAGTPGAHAIISRTDDGQIARWGTCNVTYYVNAATLPAGAMPVIEEAFAHLSAITGMTFEHGGDTSVIAFTDSTYNIEDDHGPGIYIAYANAEAVPNLAGNVSGLGGHQYTYGDGRAPEIALGAIVVDSEAPLTNDYAVPRGLGGLLEHELGHVMNLAHVEDPTQIMYPSRLMSSPATFQGGDQDGLHQTAAADCRA